MELLGNQADVLVLSDTLERKYTDNVCDHLTSQHASLARVIP